MFCGIYQHFGFDELASAPVYHSDACKGPGFVGHEFDGVASREEIHRGTKKGPVECFLDAQWRRLPAFWEQLAGEAFQWSLRWCKAQR